MAQKRGIQFVRNHLINHHPHNLFYEDNKSAKMSTLTQSDRRVTRSHTDVDEFGCMISYNSLVVEYNKHFKQLDNNFRIRKLYMLIPILFCLISSDTLLLTD